MGTITLTTVYECAGGDHLRISVTGDATDTLALYANDLTGPISDDERAIFLKVLLRLAKVGRSKQQIKNALASGLVVTV